MQVPDKGRHNTLKGLGGKQNFKRELVSIRILQNPILQTPPRLGKQFFCMEQILAQTTGRSGGRWRQRRGKYLGRQLFSKRLKQCKLFSPGDTGCGEIGVGKIGVTTSILIEKQCGVGPFKVKGKADGPANHGILENRSSGIKDKPLHTGIIFMGKTFFNQFTVGKPWPGHVALPLFGDIDVHEVKFSGLERLNAYNLVFKIFDGNGVEIKHPPAHRQIFGPVVFIALIGDGFTGMNFSYRIGAGTDRRQHDLLRIRGIKTVFFIKRFVEDG